MTIADNQNTALAFILDQYRKQIDALQPAPPVPGVKSAKSPKVKAERKPRTLKAPKVAKEPTPVKLAISVPTFAYQKQSVSPEGFFSLLRASRGMQDERNACYAYLGYSDHEAHGTQVDYCRRQATMALKPWLGNRSAKSSAEGFIAGMPDATAKQVADLLGREKLAAESLCALQVQLNEVISKLTADTLGNQEQEELQHSRNLVFGLIAIENDRLMNIRADLKALAR